MVDLHRRDDVGFTLIEVMVVTILLALVSLVMGFAISTVLRVTPSAESQISTARSVQGLTVWFPADVASAVASGANIITAPTGLICAGSESTPGTNLVELSWTVSEPATTTYVAAYRLEPGVDSDAVHRYECSSAASFGDTTSQKVTGPLASGIGTATATPSFDEVALELEARDGTPIRVEATPRNPAASLPAVTTPATVPPPPAPSPCEVKFQPSTYGPVARIASGPEAEELAASVTIDMIVTGETCGAVTIEYDTGYVTGMSRVVTVTGVNGTVTLPVGDPTPDTPRWTAATHTIEAYDNGAPLVVPSTATVEVLP